MSPAKLPGKAGELLRKSLPDKLLRRLALGLDSRVNSWSPGRRKFLLVLFFFAGSAVWLFLLLNSRSARVLKSFRTSGPAPAWVPPLEDTGDLARARDRLWLMEKWLDSLNKPGQPMRMIVHPKKSLP